MPYSLACAFFSIFGFFATVMTENMTFLALCQATVVSITLYLELRNGGRQ